MNLERSVPSLDAIAAANVTRWPFLSIRAIYVSARPPASSSPSRRCQCVRQAARSAKPRGSA